MISCGVQCLVCDYPIHLDTYSGCSHACRYCFVKQKYSIDNVHPLDSAKKLRAFINGKRTADTKWCDWAIPIHWGANSDPFQVCELEYKKSLECLEVFAETHYPFIVSTKNPVLLTSEPYLGLMSRCDCVLQISMACPKYDKLEAGAPGFKERLNAASVLSKHVTRVIARVQPFFPDCFKDILEEIPNYASAGIYGIIVEGYSTFKQQKGMQKDGSKYDFPLEVLVPMYKEIKEECHNNGLRFFCGEDRVRFLGDSLTCCGTENLEAFKPNTFNVEHLAHDVGTKAKDAMKSTDTFQPFKCRSQHQRWAAVCKGKSFEQLMHLVGDDYVEWYSELREEWS